MRGLLGIAVGVIVLAWPGISALALLYVIGGYAVVLGSSHRRIVSAPAGRPRHRLDDPHRPRRDRLRDRHLRETGRRRERLAALIAAFALFLGISELVFAVGGEKLLERKVKTLASRQSLRTTGAVALKLSLKDRT